MPAGRPHLPRVAALGVLQADVPIRMPCGAKARSRRSRRFVNLYRVVRNGLQASVQSHSIKKLEPLYGFTRGTPLSDANMALAKVQACLELGDIEFINENDRNAVAGDNRDDCDCVSTWRLRNWLETRWAELIETGPSSLDREGEGNVLRAVASSAFKSPLLKAELAGRDSA
jgi:hypothetical protein